MKKVHQKFCEEDIAWKNTFRARNERNTTGLSNVITIDSLSSILYNSVAQPLFPTQHNIQKLTGNRHFHSFAGKGKGLHHRTPYLLTFVCNHV